MVSDLERTPTDAWIVEAGSRPLLEWCAAQPGPCLALYGRSSKSPNMSWLRRGCARACGADAVQYPRQQAEKVLAKMIQGDRNRGVSVVHAPDGSECQLSGSED
jgi:hypothetical protein